MFGCALFGWLFCSTGHQPFSGHLTLNFYESFKQFSLVCGGARGVMVIVEGNGHGDTSSNPGRD